MTHAVESKADDSTPVEQGTGMIRPCRHAHNFSESWRKRDCVDCGHLTRQYADASLAISANLAKTVRQRVIASPAESLAMYHEARVQLAHGEDRSCHLHDQGRGWVV